MIFIICVGFTPLHTACQVYGIDLVRALMENGADPKAMDRRGFTTKDYCCRDCLRYNCEEKCKLIQGIFIILILDLFI
jgi:ankyrin repeat protein